MSMVECCRGVGESEGHDVPLERSVADLEGGFRFIFFSNSDLVETTGEVYLGEVFSGGQLIQHFVNQG